MHERNQLDIHLPVYNIKAVAQMTGLRPVTLRAWERRYGIPSPSRGDQGYRLYSEYDLRTLHWLKYKIDSGLSISRAVEYLVDLRSKGQDPTFEIKLSHHTEQLVTYENLKEKLYDTLVHFNEAAASVTLRRAFSIYTVEQVLELVIHPTLVEIGESWHRGELPVAVEHFASQYCVQQLMNLISASREPYHQEVIVAAGAPGEMHQIGLLMLVVMLRWRGWDVKYLGPDLKLDGLAKSLEPVRPQMILFTATRPETALELVALPQVLEKFPEPHPVIVLGGKGFLHLPALENIPGTFIDATPERAVQIIESVLQKKK